MSAAIVVDDGNILDVLRAADAWMGGTRNPTAYTVDYVNLLQVLTDAADFLGRRYVLRSEEVPSLIRRTVKRMQTRSDAKGTQFGPAVNVLRIRCLTLAQRQANDEVNRSPRYDAARRKMAGS